MAWAILNDSFHSASSATVPAQRMAAGCVYAAAGLLGVDTALYLKTYLERFDPELRWAAEDTIATGAGVGPGGVGDSTVAAAAGTGTGTATGTGTPLEQLAAQLRRQAPVAAVGNVPPGPDDSAATASPGRLTLTDLEPLGQTWAGV